MSDDERVGDAMCCFCGRYLPFTEAVTIGLHSRDGESTQGLHAHRECLRRVVVSDIVLITELDDE